MDSVDNYENHVNAIEEQSGIGPFGFKTGLGARVDKNDVFAELSDEWKTASGRARLEGRTPVALDRDRILYSDEFRRLDDKFHVLFFGANRLKRTYTSHITKVAQVARSVAGRLALNADLAEAIVLGSKVGGVPFIHVGKVEVANWVKKKIQGLDVRPEGDRYRNSNATPAMFDLGKNGELVLPGWLDSLQSEELQRKVSKLVPWAAGSSGFPAYASGQQSYWMLSLNPYTLQTTGNDYLAQTMYGIWQHSLVEPTSMPANFSHDIKIDEVDRAITQDHASHEAALVRFCDDITWILENLAEASRVASIDTPPGPSPFEQLATKYKKDFSEPVRTALFDKDPGALYTYFIDDLVKTSRHLMASAGGAVSASEAAPLVSLSDHGKRTMSIMKSFLMENIFLNERMAFRSTTLEGITNTALDVLYRSYEGELSSRMDTLAKIGQWEHTGELEDAKGRLGDLVHRTQVAVNVLASMSDREVFELVGLE